MLADRVDEFVRRFAVIPDHQERLAAVIARRPRLEPLAESEVRDEALVPGCVSRVWLTGEVVEDLVRLRISADSQVVGGLASALCEVADGEPADEVEALDLSLLAGLGILDIISPTRANGLEQVAKRIRAIAAGAQ